VPSLTSQGTSMVNYVSPALAEGAQKMLELIPESFRLYPLTDMPERIDPVDWATTLREHPQYVDGKWNNAALTLAHDRTILEQMSPEYQQLGGTLIRVMLSNEELNQIHRGEL